MAILKEIETEYLDSAMVIAFFYSDDTISWIMIENGEVIKKVKQRPHTTGRNIRPRGFEEGFCGGLCDLN